MIAAYRAGGRHATDYQVAWVTVALRDLRVRDDAWARMDPVHLDAHRRLWTDVTRRAQPGYVAAPAALLAFVAWQSGDGALANVALDRALADDPRYSMALLLRQVITAGAPPSLARLPMTPEEGGGQLRRGRSRRRQGRRRLRPRTGSRGPRPGPRRRTVRSGAAARAAPLPGHGDLPGPAVDVGQGQGGDLAGDGSPSRASSVSIARSRLACGRARMAPASIAVTCPGSSGMAGRPAARS